MNISLTEKGSSRKRFIIFSLTLPVVLYAVFILYPTISIFSSSFFRWSGVTTNKTFVGWKNFVFLLQDELFYISVRNTFILIVLSVICTISLALFFAVCIVQSDLKENSFYRVLFFFPNVLSVVVISIIFKYLYAPNNGVINSFLALFGIKGPVWLGDPSVVLHAVNGAMVWQAVGYYMLIYIAGLDGISSSLFEAADLDGAGPMRKFFCITIPQIWEVLRVTLVFFILSSLNLSFIFVRVMTNSGPNNSSEVMLTYMYKQAFRFGNFGYAMASAFVIFLICFGLSLVSQKVTERNWE